MMLRTRATGQRLVASITISSSRRARGENLRTLTCNETFICRLSAVSTSAHHPNVGTPNIQAAASHVLSRRGRMGYSSMITARNFSPQHAPDFSNFDEMDSEPLMSPQVEPNSYTSPTKRDDKPHRATKKSGSDEDNAIPKQSTQAARILFASIAPHVEFRTLHQLMKQLTKILSLGQHHLIDGNDRAGKKRALKRRLSLLFDKKASQSGEYSWSVKSHPWIESILYQFLMGKFMEHPDAMQRNTDDSKQKLAAMSKALSYQADDSYPVNRNRAHFQKNVSTLMKAREMSLDYPMFWTEKAVSEYGYYVKTGTQKDKGISKKKQVENLAVVNQIKKVHSEKTSIELANESEHLLEFLIHKLPQPHFEKLMKELGKFAEVEGNLAEKKRDSWYIKSDDEDKSPSNWHKAADNRPFEEIKPKKTKQNKITVIGTTLHKISSSHSHIVAAELGRYFYAVDLPLRDVPRASSASSGDKKQPAAEKPDSSTWTPMRPQDVTAAVRRHRKLTDTEKKFEKLRTNFVERLVELQHEFASWEDKCADASEDDDEIPDGSDDTSPDLMVKEFQREHMSYKAGARKHQEEALAETLVELQKMGMRTDEDVKKRRGRRRKGTHLRFTAVKMEENPTYASELSEKEAEMEERIVFINNLPIDTTQEEVDQIYSRCGPLDSIQLFNLRPDLDPGPLNKKQLEERKRKQRLSNPDTYATYQQQSRQRPRTPVYGILTFQTTEGFNIATGPEMSLFGCVIRRHPVMSIKPSAMKTLYLENIPQNLLSIELEYKLARLLHPHQMHVMQDGMRGVSNGGHQFSVSIDHEEYSEPSSCEVKFEDFHTANAAYQWMKGESSTGDKPYATFMNCDDCEVHWFRTPADKMKYWTRELNF